MVRLFLIDDHSIVREGLKILLEKNPKYRIVGESDNAEVFLEEIDNGKIDLLITDLTLPKKSGIELIKELRKKPIPLKILVLTMHDDETNIIQAFKLGANGYMLKHEGREELFKAIDKIMEGQNYCGESILKTVTHTLINKQGISENFFVSNREKDIIVMLSEGMNTKRIAEKLSLSTKTIDNQRTNIMRKLGVKNSSELIAYAIRNKLI